MEPTPHTDLRASQARHQLLSCLLDYIPDRIYFKDKDGAFILVSRSEAEYLGAVNPGEVIGKTDFDFFEAPLAQASLDDERSLMQTGDSVTGKEEKKLLLDGRTGWALVDKIPLRDAEGAIIGTCGISKDITRLKEAEEAMRDIEADELFVVLSGSARVDFADGSASLDLGPGDVVQLAAGTRTEWTVHQPLRKVYLTPS
jgi:PAS domain S-box-containing protein